MLQVQKKNENINYVIKITSVPFDWLTWVKCLFVQDDNQEYKTTPIPYESGHYTILLATRQTTLLKYGRMSVVINCVFFSYIYHQAMSWNLIEMGVFYIIGVGLKPIELVLTIKVIVNVFALFVKNLKPRNIEIVPINGAYVSTSD